MRHSFIGLVLLFAAISSFVAVDNSSSERQVSPITIAGMVTDGASGLSCASVELENMFGLAFQTYTNESGNFSFSVAPGGYTLFASKDGYVQGRLKNIAASDNITNLTLILDRSAIISGFVTCEGAPIDGIIVVAMGNNSGLSTTTDASGWYNLSRDIVEGEVALSIASEGYVEYSNMITVEKGGYYRLDISLMRSASLEGRVTDRMGAPVICANVTVVGDIVEYQVTTNATGFFWLSLGLSNGTYNISVSKTGFTTSRKTINIPFEGTLEIIMQDFLNITFPCNETISFSDTIDVCGNTEPGSAVAVVNNATSNEGYADMYGNFSIPITLNEGANNITITSTCNEYSEARHVVVFRVPRISVTIISPLQNATLNCSTKISGYVNGSRAHSNPIVEVAIDNSEYFVANGTWSFERMWNIDERANGRHIVSVRARDLATGVTAYSNVTVEVYVSVYREARVDAPKGRTAKPGEVLTYEFVVYNEGEKRDSFKLVVESRSGWLCEADQVMLDGIEPGTLARVSVLLAIPSNAHDGWKDELTLSAISAYDAETESAGRVTTTVISDTFANIPGGAALPFVLVAIALACIACGSFYLGKSSNAGKDNKQEDAPKPEVRTVTAVQTEAPVKTVIRLKRGK